jgi:hypothetical protein
MCIEKSTRVISNCKEWNMKWKSLMKGYKINFANQKPNCKPKSEHNKNFGLKDPLEDSLHLLFNSYIVI